MGHPKLNKHPELLKRKPMMMRLKVLKYKPEKHDHGNILKSPKIQNDYSGKKYKFLNEKMLLLRSSGTALLTSIVILLTDEYISKLKTRYNKLRDWTNVIGLLYEKAQKQYMVDL